MFTNLPSRPAGAVSGRAFLATTQAATAAAREQAILAEILAGNFPDFLRAPVEVTRAVTGATLTLRVFPDYLAVGADDDFVRMPMTPVAAQRIADAWGCLLPTRVLVDAIWKQAAQLPFHGLFNTPPCKGDMHCNDCYALHQQRIEADRAQAGTASGALVAGHKKDVIIANAMHRPVANNHQLPVVIYGGWERGAAHPVQPVYAGHEHLYADYSHGIRLVDPEALVDGVPTPVAEILADPVRHVWLSDDGAIPDPRYPTA